MASLVWVARPPPRDVDWTIPATVLGSGDGNSLAAISPFLPALSALSTRPHFCRSRAGGQRALVPYPTLPYPSAAAAAAAVMVPLGARRFVALASSAWVHGVGL